VGEFARLGVTDRAERLAVSAALLNLADLDTTSHLTMGDAGRLLSALQHTVGRAELPVLTAVDEVDDQSAEQAGGRTITWPEVIAQIIATALGVLAEPTAAAEQDKETADG
jgi:hypothetical protein